MTFFGEWMVRGLRNSVSIQNEGWRSQLSVVSPFLLFLCSALSHVRFLFFLSAPLPCPASLLRAASAHAFSHTCSLVLTGSHELEASAFPILLPPLLFPHLPSRTQQPKSTSAVLCSGRELSPGEPPGGVPGPPHQLTFHPPRGLDTFPSSFSLKLPCSFLQEMTRIREF